MSLRALRTMRRQAFSMLAANLNWRFYRSVQVCLLHQTGADRFLQLFTFESFLESCSKQVTLSSGSQFCRASRPCVRELHSRPRLWQLQGAELNFFRELEEFICHQNRRVEDLRRLEDSARLKCESMWMWGLPEGQRELSWSGLVSTPKLWISRMRGFLLWRCRALLLRRPREDPRRLKPFTCLFASSLNKSIYFPAAVQYTHIYMYIYIWII